MPPLPVEPPELSTPPAFVSPVLVVPAELVAPPSPALPPKPTVLPPTEVAPALVEVPPKSLVPLLDEVPPTDVAPPDASVVTWVTVVAEQPSKAKAKAKQNPEMDQRIKYPPIGEVHKQTGYWHNKFIGQATFACIIDSQFLLRTIREKHGEIMLPGPKNRLKASRW